MPGDGVGLKVLKAPSDGVGGDEVPKRTGRVGSGKETDERRKFRQGTFPAYTFRRSL